MSENILDIVKKFKQEGYVVVKNFLTKQTCDELINYLSTLEAKVNLPYTNVPWGYGNLLNQGPFSKISEHEFIKNFVKICLMEILCSII